MAYYYGNLEHDTGYHIDDEGNKHPLLMMSITKYEYNDLVCKLAVADYKYTTLALENIGLKQQLYDTLSAMDERCDLPENLDELYESLTKDPTVKKVREA